ncbi:MAG: carboxypeptidase-like regulatory domain-containing protein, partial [Bacteroidota bacterium]
MEKIFGLVILFLVPYLAHTQQNEQFFDHQNLSQIIQTIEHQTSYTFNYNPQQLAQYYFTGTFDFKDVSTALKKLLQDTPFTFEQGEHSILIFQAETQTYRLCGYVKDRLSGATLPLANIYMDQSTQGTQSDENGYFDYSFTALKNQKIVVSYVGYLAQIVDVHSFEEGQCQDVLLVIDEQSLHSEIIVTDYLLDAITEGENYSSVRIDYQNSSSRQTNVEQDVLRTVQLISGVSSTDESASNISIRGNVPDQNLIVWEGATLYDAGHVFGLVSAINPFLVENISVYKGVFDPSYDNRVGGIIDIQLSDSLSNRFRGGIGSTMTEAHAYLNTPIIKDKLSLLLGVRNTIADLAYTPTLQSYTVRVFQDTKVEESLEDEETQSGHELNYHDWNAKLIFQATDRLSIKASILRNLNDYNFSADFFEDRLTSNDNLNTTASAFGLSAAMRWNDKISSEWAFRSSNTQNEYYFNIFNDTRTYYSNHLQNGIIDQSFLWTNDFQKGQNWAYRLGYEYNFKAVEFSIETTDLFEPNYNDFNFLQGGYHHLIGTFQYQNQKLQINAGLRNTYDVEV